MLWVLMDCSPEGHLCGVQGSAAMGLTPLAMPAELPAAAALAFAPGSNRLLLATSDAKILVIDPAESAVRLHSDQQRTVYQIAHPGTEPQLLHAT